MSFFSGLIGEFEATPARADAAVKVPVIAGPAVTRLGELWQMGSHRSMCGNAHVPKMYARLLAGETAQLAST